VGVVATPRADLAGNAPDLGDLDDHRSGLTVVPDGLTQTVRHRDRGTRGGPPRRGAAPGSRQALAPGHRADRAAGTLGDVGLARLAGQATPGAPPPHEASARRTIWLALLMTVVKGRPGAGERVTRFDRE
jgi:hypothetical protein